MKNNNNGQGQDMNTRFTALGMSGVGKTCYILGMYNTMSIGQNGFLLTTNVETACDLQKKIDILRNNKIGLKRFPTGTPTSEVIPYSFTLSHHAEDIMTFDWIDYGGGVLEQGIDSPVFSQLEESIIRSTALYIFIDGGDLCAESKEERMQNVQWKCASKINPYIKKFMDAHPNGMPPVIFVVTKLDLCEKHVKDDEVPKIILNSFSPVFGKGSIVYITGVTLGKKIADDNYTGKVDPKRIHIPFFLGIFHEFSARVNNNLVKHPKKEDLTQLKKNKELLSEIKSELNCYKEYFVQYIDGQRQNPFTSG